VSLHDKQMAECKVMVLGPSVLSLVDLIIRSAACHRRVTGSWKKYAKPQQAQGAAGTALGGMSGGGAVSQKQECLWRIEWFNLHTATFFETKQTRAGIATALMAHTKQYLLSPAGLQNAASTAVALQNDALIDANAQPNPTLVPTLGGPSAKSLAKQSANPEHVQVGTEVDNTVAS